MKWVLNQLSIFFKQKEVILSFFVFFSLILNWPFISIYDRGSPYRTYFTLFGIWALLIICLYLVGNSWENVEAEAMENEESPPQLDSLLQENSKEP